MIDFNALSKITYGLYIVSSGDKNSGNGYIANTVFQITSSPAKFVVSCNKDNYTNELIKKHKAFSVSVLGIDAPTELFGTFGYNSGKDIDKFKSADVIFDETGVPIVTNSTTAYLEFKLDQEIDMGTHTMFVGELINTKILDDSKESMTYEYYRSVKKGLSPKNAPTYIDKSKLEKPDKEIDSIKHECSVCGHIHDDSEEENTFDKLSGDWTCPICGAEKSDFTKV